MSIHLFPSIKNHNEPASRPCSPFHTLLRSSCSFIFFINHIKMSPSPLFFFFFVTTAAFSNFKSSSSSPSPSNGISINLLNGFKTSLALVRVSKARIGPWKHGHSLAELVLFQGSSVPTGSLSLLKLMGLEEAANPRFYYQAFKSRAELMTAPLVVHEGERD